MAGPSGRKVRKALSPTTVDEWRALVLSFVGSLTLCDHMGDVAGDIEVVLDRIGWQGDWDDLGELGSALGREDVQTLYGTSLADDDEEAEALD